MSDLEPGDPLYPLWKVLGQASKVEHSPFFARNVVREARLLGKTPAGFWDRLRLLAGPRAIFATAACALVAVAMVMLFRDGGADSGPVAIALNSEETIEAFDPASEMAAVEYLGQLMAVVDPGQLDDAALADLFF